MVRVAFVTEQGAAHRSKYQEALRDNARVAEVLLMDPEGATFEEGRHGCGAKVTAAETTVERLLGHGRPDLAIVSLIAAHAPAVIEPLLEAGVHVMAEKPACTDPDQFARLVQVAERRGVQLDAGVRPALPAGEDGRPAHHRRGRHRLALCRAGGAGGRSGAHPGPRCERRLDLSQATRRRRPPDLARHPHARSDPLPHRCGDRGGAGDDGRGRRPADRRGRPGAGQLPFRGRRPRLAVLRLSARRQARPRRHHRIRLHRLAAHQRRRAGAARVERHRLTAQGGCATRSRAAATAAGWSARCRPVSGRPSRRSPRTTGWRPCASPTPPTARRRRGAPWRSRGNTGGRRAGPAPWTGRRHAETRVRPTAQRHLPRSRPTVGLAKPGPRSRHA